MATRRFYKMSGSGNDFIIFDARQEPVGALDDQIVIQALCERGTGVGADGVVFLEPAEQGGIDFRMRYFNSDGLPAALCGNAALCVTRLASDLGAGSPDGMLFGTDSGVVSARMVGPLPEIDLLPAREVRPTVDVALIPGERRIGYAVTGVPHLVLLCDSVDQVDVVGRGRALRMDPAFRPNGANVNFIATRPDGSWAIRTYERGVEGETLACGTGATASAVLLNVWGLSGTETTLVTRSGRPLTVRLREDGQDVWPMLRGEGRLVFTGDLADR
jgi:diaminopimelate epimerase